MEKYCGVLIIIILTFFLTAPVTAIISDQPESTGYSVDYNLNTDNEIDTARADVGYFTENNGQWNPELDFVASTSFGYIGLSRQNVYYYLIDSEDTGMHVLKFTFESSLNVIPKGLDPLPQISNYFYGNDSDMWVTGVKSYRMIIYKNLWDNIDLIYNMDQQGLKYELVARPAADLADIHIKVEGHEELSISNSNLIINLHDGENLVDRNLKVFYLDNDRDYIDASFKVIDQDCYTFSLNNYDASREVVIDPFIYSTFLGGSNGDTGYAIQHDSQENAYVTGVARSVDFPTTAGAHDEEYNTDWDVFVTKYDPTGSNIIYSTYVGGDFAEIGYGIDVDKSFNAYVTGYTASSDFPWTSGANDTIHNGNNDVFVFKLDQIGSGLTYCTFLGGSGSDIGRSIYVDVDLRAYITGDTTSDNWPTTMLAIDKTLEGPQDVLIAILDSTGSSLVTSSYFGGDGSDSGRDLDLGPGREPFITGETTSSNLPTNAFAFSPTYNGGETDGFVIRVNGSYGFLTYCTYFGGSGADAGEAIRLNGSNYAIVTGETKSADFPTSPGCYDSVYKGGGVYADVFVMSFSQAGASINFSTFVSGSNNDYAFGLDRDQDKNIYVTGYTQSLDFPTTPDAYNDTLFGARDAILFKLDPVGESLLYSSYIGGGLGDTGYDLVMDKSENAYVTGETWSSDFPATPGANDTSYNTNGDAFVFKFQFAPSLSPPRGLTAELGYGYADLSWLEPAVTGGSPVIGYNVYRGIISGGESFLTSVGNILNYNDTTITPGQVYYYYVTALNSTGESGASNEAIATELTKPKFIADNTPMNLGTGDEFTFSVKVIDNLMMNSVYVDYWIGTENHNNVSMTNITKTDWEYTIQIPHKLETLHYIFYATDLYSNFNFTVQNNLTIEDNDLTVFGTDSTSTELTTGEEFEFQIQVTDNIEVDEVWVDFWFDPLDLTNASMLKINSDTWWYPLEVQPDETYPLHYIFHANDTSDNWNLTDEIVVNVTDNDHVMFIIDNTPTTATTGESFTFSVEVTDNILVDDVRVEYWYGSSGPNHNQSMTQGTGDDWQLTIIAGHTLDNLNYIFHARDPSGTWNKTGYETVTMIDNDKPVFDKYIYPTTPSTGDEFTFLINITDNINVKNASIDYRFGDHGTPVTSSLLKIIGYYQAIIDIPTNSLESLHFMITAYDAYGNPNTTSIFDVTIIDGITPTIEKVSDQSIVQGELFNLTVSASDNIGITEVIWSGSPIASTNLKLEGIVNDPGQYPITVTVKDSAGNSNSTTFILTVLNSTLDTDGDGMPDWWENEHGLDPNDPSDANEDPDKDGISNLDEYLGGTDPNKYDGEVSPDDITPGGQDTDKGEGEFEDYFWVMVLILIIVIVIIIVIAVILMKKREGPEELPSIAEGERLPEIAPPEQLAVPVSYPDQELVSPAYLHVQEPAYPELGGVELPDQIEIPAAEKSPQLGQPPKEVGQIPAPLPAEQLPGNGYPQPQLPPSEPAPVPATASPVTEPPQLAQPLQTESGVPEPDQANKPVQTGTEEIEE
jgi:hypothetical protein